jgi:hypothetical protein
MAGYFMVLAYVQLMMVDVWWLWDMFSVKVV